MWNSILQELQRCAQSHRPQQQHVRCEQLLGEVSDAFKCSALCQTAVADISSDEVQGCLPDFGRSQTAREKGSAAFRSGHYDRSLGFYNEALQYLDASTSYGRKAASQLHANRCLCLMKLQPSRLSDALSEADNAVHADSSNQKAWYRKAAVLEASGKLPEAREAAEQGLTCLEISTPSSASSTARSDFESLLMRVDQSLLDSNQKPGQADLPTTTYNAASGLKPRCDNSSSNNMHMISVGRSSECGRQLLAAGDIPAGTDVHVEQPLTLTLLKAARKQRCSKCGDKLRGYPSTPVPVYCLHCPMVQYCSRDCRDSDPWHTPHGPECGVAWARVLPEHALQAVRLARAQQAQHGSDCQEAATTMEDNPSVKQSSKDATCHTSVSSNTSKSGLAQRLCRDLIGHANEARPCEDALVACATAVIASQAYNNCLQRCKQKQAKSGLALRPCDSTPLTAQQVLTSYLQIQCNGLMLRPVGTSSPEDSWAVGLYPMLACANHSCRPNMTLRFTDTGTVIARVIKSVTKGTPLTISYGPQEGQRMTQERRHILQQHYFFTCCCPACTSPSLQEVTWGPLRHAVKCNQPGCKDSQGWWVPCARGVLPLPNSNNLHAVQDSTGTSIVGRRLDDANTMSSGKSGVITVDAVVQPCSNCGYQASDAEVRLIESQVESLQAQLQGCLQRMETSCCSVDDVVRNARVMKECTSEISACISSLQRLSHHGNQQLGTCAHKAAVVMTRLLQIIQRSMSVSSQEEQQAKPAVVSSDSQLSFLSQLLVVTYQCSEISHHVVCLHYPPCSVQVAFEKARMSQFLKLISDCNHRMLSNPSNDSRACAAFDINCAPAGRAQLLHEEARHVLVLNFGHGTLKELEDGL